MATEITSTYATVLAGPPSVDHFTAHNVIVLYAKERYRLSELPKLKLGPGETVKLKIVAIEQWKGRGVGTLVIKSNASNRPVYRIELDSRT